MSFADFILVVADDASIARAMSLALRETEREVRAVATAGEAMAAARDEHPELIVLDVGTSLSDGIAVCRALRDETQVPIIVLGVRRAEIDAVQLLNAGADDFIARPFAVAELVARIKAQLRRASVYRSGAPNVIRVGSLALDQSRRTASRDGVDVRLTPVEWQLFRALATNAGRTLTHQQLYHAVWGNVFGDAQQTLRVHIAHLRRKIEAVPRAPTLIVTEPGVGYRCEQPRPTPAKAG
jgi:two-component system KDP operon response regulator KdpE